MDTIKIKYKKSNINFIRYINTLLEEVLDDTVKHVTGVEKNNAQHSWQRTKNNMMKSQIDKSKENNSIKKDGDNFFIDINPHLPAEQWSTENECKRQFAGVSMGEGYVNPAFIGSTDELASIDFDCSARKHSKRYITDKMRLCHCIISLMHSFQILLVHNTIFHYFCIFFVK